MSARPSIPPAGCVIVREGTTDVGDLVWNRSRKLWEPCDSVNAYVFDYIAVARLKLKPCPWCAGEARMTEREGLIDLRRFTVGCSTEHCFGYHSYVDFQRRGDAQKAWNRRKP